ncbi:MAG: hypothetical protein ACLU0O_02330 [Collinsella sp.]
MTSEEILPLVRSCSSLSPALRRCPRCRSRGVRQLPDQNLPWQTGCAPYLDRDLADIDEKHLHYQQA